MGLEDVDVEKNYSYKNLAKSKLFLVPTIANIHYGLYAGTIALVFFVNSGKASETQLVTWWASIALLLQIPFMLYAAILVKRHIKFSFPYIHTAKYVVATVTFVVVFFFTSGMIIDYKNNIYIFLPKVFIQLLICLVIYLLVTLAIDGRTRVLFKSVVKELLSR